MNPSRRTSDTRRQKSGFRTGYNPQYGQQFGPEPQLFNDTSGYIPPYPSSPNQAGVGWAQTSFPGQQFLTDPMASMAMQYGQAIAGEGKVMVEEKLEKYVSLSKLKYYFAVDTRYVIRKLGIILFPFTHTDWAVRFTNENEPVAPRYDINSPDLYIPSMAFVTYILIAGYILGANSMFSPEQLGIQASSALGWSMVEILVFFLALYLLSASLKVFDLIAFCSYKYVCMVAALLACIFLKSVGYYAVLGYTSLSLGFFLLRTLRVLILPKTTSDHFSSNGRHSSYLLLAICLAQPFFMYVLTKHLVIQQQV